MGSYAKQFNVQANAFRHNPYSCHNVTVPVAIPVARTPPRAPPAGAVIKHHELEGKVDFVAYPEFAPDLSACVLPHERMQRVFIGHLPYAVTDAQVAWLCQHFAGVEVFDIEHIVKRAENVGKNGARPAPATLQPNAVIQTGCIHAYVYPGRAAELTAVLDHRVLIDDAGIWFAADAEQKAALDVHCAEVKGSAMRRRELKGRPFSAVVAEEAQSTYRPRSRTVSPPPAAVAVAPPAYAEFVDGSYGAAAMMPPGYNFAQ